jgi:hypothetical protein
MVLILTIFLIIGKLFFGRIKLIQNQKITEIIVNPMTSLETHPVPHGRL